MDEFTNIPVPENEEPEHNFINSTSPASSSSDYAAEIMTNWASVGRHHDHMNWPSATYVSICGVCVCVHVPACVKQKKCICANKRVQVLGNVYMNV